MAATSFLGSPALLKPQTTSQASTAAPLKTNLAIKAAQGKDEKRSRRNIVGIAAAALLVGGLLSGEQAKAGLVEDLLAKSAANKELNDKKRLTTSGANLARAYTVEFNTCRFPYNFTGCQDLAKKQDVKFLSDDLKLECEGKDKYKCGSNVFWKWGK
ncbi:photosystem I reaction center subunit N, chloroplastic [Selaginella moellendorffii]|uniref:photosystem I reaction center subunit N, chloroplastic n=1 Tax=Selaginella moellendorffii TaxID=88036 RepID=UPI000D1C56E9|nr:photosystem I reaction center subunit N, chloroplastic [Selaginella moellendorffii]|eukprot:XP_002973992.2 photosystem I reaction center subunit N, chloroplastic [Selaginella moellendorffii]